MKRYAYTIEAQSAETGLWERLAIFENKQIPPEKRWCRYSFINWFLNSFIEWKWEFTDAEMRNQALRRAEGEYPYHKKTRIARYFYLRYIDTGEMFLINEKTVWLNGQWT